MKKFLVRSALACGLLLATIPSESYAWVLGDVFAAVGNGQVNRYDAAGNFVQTLDMGTGGFTTGMAFDATGNLYVTNFENNQIGKFDASGNYLGLFGSGHLSNPESILFDQAGNAYVGYAGADQIQKFDAAGNMLDAFTVTIQDRGTDWIDLAADQTTMYYTSEGNRIFRYDLGTSTQLADFGLAPDEPIYAFRLLGDGGMLLAGTSAVWRFDAAGNVVNTFDVAGEDTWFALNLDPNGTSFWSGNFSSGNAYQFDIATGNVLQSIGTGSSSFFGLAVFGEITQGGGGDPVPEPASMLLMGVGLAGVAIRKRFARK